MGDWDESKHPREPAGSDKGGEFASAGAWSVEKEDAQWADVPYGTIISTSKRGEVFRSGNKKTPKGPRAEFGARWKNKLDIGDNDMSGLNLFARLTKVDEAKRLVFGRAVQQVPDQSGEIFDYATSRPHFEEWSNSINEAAKAASGTENLGNVRAMHGKVAAGKLVEVNYDDAEKAVDVAAYIADDNEWKKVLDGVYTGFSIGGRYAKKWNVIEDGKSLKAYTAVPAEISLVDRPCIPTCTFFEVRKADGSATQVEFVKSNEWNEEDHPRDEDGKFTDGGNRAYDRAPEAKASAKKPTEKRPSAEDLTELVAQHGGYFKAGNGDTVRISRIGNTGYDFKATWPDGETHNFRSMADLQRRYGLKLKDIIVGVTEKLLKVVLNGKDTEISLVEEDVEIGKHFTLSDGDEIVITKIVDDVAHAAPVIDGVVEPEVAGTEADVLKLQSIMEEHKLTVADVVDMTLAKVAERDDVNPKAGEAKYGDVQFADAKNKKYPIDTEEHIRAAWNYINKAKNSAKYSPADVSTIKKHIVAAWKRVIDKEGPPSADKADRPQWLEKADGLVLLGKGLYNVQVLARLVDSLDELAEACHRESATEGDDSPLPGKLDAAVATLAQVLRDMIVEETQEIVDGTDADEDAPSYPQLAMSDDPEDLRKVLTKFGARNSSADKKHIQAIHDASSHLGADCAKEEAAEKIAAPAAGDDKLQKAFDELSKRVEELAKAATAPKVALRVVPVSKDQDTQASQEGGVTIQPVYDAFGKLDAAATAMKMVHATGGTPIISGKL